MSHREVVMRHTPRGQTRDTHLYRPRTLRPPAWQSVCAHAQVFRKNLHHLVGKSSTKRAPASALSELIMMPYSRQVLARQLALRELERLARLGAAVLLALHRTRVPG